MTQGYVDLEKALWAILGCTVTCNLIYTCYISTEKEFKLFEILDFAIVGESYG